MHINLFFSVEHLFRGRRKISELKQLSQDEDDFNYRRLFIEEMELEIKYLYHWKKFTKHLAFLLLLTTPINIYLFLPSIISFILSLYYNNKVNNTYLEYKMGRDIINIAIYRMYGIRLD